MSTYEMIQAAAKRLEGKAVTTPLLSSPILDKIAGRPIFVKAECLQHTGSFKFRGGYSAVSALTTEERDNGVIAFSSGNHAQGVAMAAREYRIPALIIMPKDTSTSKLESTEALGSEIVLFDRASEDQNEVFSEINRSRNMTLIHPYDNHQVIAGQGTVGLEIAKQATNANIKNADVLVCCGGGGLTSGIALALAKIAPSLNVRTCEPVGFDDTARSLVLGQIQSNIQTTGSICDAILTTEPGEITFPIMHRLCGHGIVVTDKECLRAMVAAYDAFSIIIEPGGAVALAAALYHKHEIHADSIIAVATGGNVDSSIFRMALDKYGKVT